MSLLKKTKSKKLNALVMASLLTFGFMSSVEAVGYRQLISYDSFPTSRPGSYDFGGNYESTIDYSREFYIQVDRSTTNIRGNEDSDGNAGTVTSTKYWYYTPVDKTVYFSGGSTTFKAGELYLVDIQTETNGGLDPDIGITHLGDAERILNGGLSEDEIKDLISNVEGNQTVNGSQTVNGGQTVTGGQTVSGGQTVNGDSTTNGNSTTTGNSTIKGDNNTEGDSNVEGDSNIGGDLNVDGDGTVDGDMNVGYEGADEDGDGTPDRPGDLNVAGNTNTEGNQDVTGDSHIGGNETVDGNETVKGDSFVEGNGHFDGNVSIGNRDENGNATDSSDLDVTGNGNFGGDVNIGHDGVDEDGDGTPDRPGNLDVAGDSHLTGDTQVGSRDDVGSVVDRSDLDVTGNANLGGDTFVGYDGVDSNGDGVVDRPGNMYIAGDTVIGVPGVPGAESNLHVTGNTTIDHDLYVGGDGHFDGNLYAPDLIFNGGKSLTGEISRLDGRIDTAGANAAALAGLHPLDFDEDQKLNFAAAVGSYQGASAMALGMFYRPDDRTMFNLGGTFGNRENMATLGISFALDGPNAVSRSSKKKMQEQIVQLTAANAVMAENNAKMQTELEELKAMVMELKAEKAA